jgi:uncharacterized membrane protein YcaP (DUF421 family)
MWTPESELGEIAIRVVVLYLSLFAMVRLAGKREVGQLSPIDLLGMLLLSETVSPALSAGDRSIGGSLAAAAVLLGTSVAVSRIAFHFPRAEKWIEGRPVELVRDGKLIEDAARSERISRQEVETALRRQGLERIAQVRRATVEPTGEITVVAARAPDGTGSSA